MSGVVEDLVDEVDRRAAGELSRVKVASIDGTADGVRAIQSGQMLVSPGGEFINGGLALINVYDVIKGKARANRAVVLNSLPVTKANVDSYDTERQAKTADLQKAFDSQYLVCK